MYKQTTSLILALALGSTATIPLVESFINPAPVTAQTPARQFNDVSDNHWANQFITALVSRGVIAGFPDGTFKPEAPVTRAQFAAMVQKAMTKNNIRSAPRFQDVASNYWANDAISRAYSMGFLSGYPGDVFRPEQNIPREQVLVSLANGLNYSATNDVNTVVGFYNDNGSISNFARAPIAAATEKKIVVNYPSPQQLNPQRNATRAEVAALIYQGLLSQGQVSQINSPYIVTQLPVSNNNNLMAGTQIPVSYRADKILITKQETAPITLKVSQNVVNSQGSVLIPRDSEVKGELRPTENGTRFIAQQLILTNGRTYTINASSQVITETESVARGTDTGNLLKNAALGTAAAAAISAVTGDRAIATEELLIGTGGGILATLIPQFLGMNRVDLLVIRPETDLNVTLNQPLVIN
ncbi:MAG: S-layer homology domain-containing protein [Cyanobacterium sp. T60_A2020_053]|nr:S-layer homology domain-containing protein [Cyanobacterium sp. T60_A2020_053]